MDKAITIHGAAEHNLKKVSLSIPRDRFVVMTGVSGSGKSSLAFDTIFAEGQRKYMESLSSYARQFLRQLKKPSVETIEGLPPTIAIEQRSASHNPRSTVATTTEIYDYLRLLFARAGQPRCWHQKGKKTCLHPIERQAPSQVVEAILQETEGTRLYLLAPLIQGKKGFHKETIAAVRREGFVRMRVNGKIYDIDEDIDAESENPFDLARYEKHNIEVIVSRLVIRPEKRQELADAVETSFMIGKGSLIALMQENKEAPFREVLFSEHFSCPHHPDHSLAELEPRLFSFNSPHGACLQCNGLGIHQEFALEEMLNANLSLSGGAFVALEKLGYLYKRHYMRLVRNFCRRKKISMQTPFCELPEEVQQVLLYGKEAVFSGLLPLLHQRLRETENDRIRETLQKMMQETLCPACQGARLRPEALHVFLPLQKGKEINIQSITEMSVAQAEELFQKLKLSKEKAFIAQPILKEIQARLNFLNSVGLGYLHLSRKTGSLSGGEAQRIRLATQIGTGLVGVCYVLDEPTIGLHPCDNARLIDSLKQLSRIGNTVLVVEHDEAVMRAADYLIDVGPGPGVHGGSIVAAGSIKEVCKEKLSVTGAFLSGKRQILPPPVRRKLSSAKSLALKNASKHNLKNLSVHFPLGGLLAVSGVSGSGKSTLVNEELLKPLQKQLQGRTPQKGPVKGADQLHRVLHVDQSPIGKTPRSNPATYTGLFDELRALYSQVPEAKARAYEPRRFSFNVKGGRCEACQGQGTKKVEMHFLPDVYVTCESCQGKRYNSETLEIHYRGKSISDVLEMTVEYALEFFHAYPKIVRILQSLIDVGLEYLQLGQQSPTLSGGEAQRIKLAAELSRVSREAKRAQHTLYILDEPTTGLHFADVEKILTAFQSLVDYGNTVLVIEHNLDILKCADWIIDMGPTGGDGGGQIIDAGPPEKLAKNKKSQTGVFLSPLLTKKA